MRAPSWFLRRWRAGLRTGSLVASLALCLLAPLPGAAQSPAAGPEQLVAGIVAATVEAMKAERAALHGTYGAATGLAIATRVIAPHVDFERLTRDAVGPSWEAATPTQQATLHAQFRTLLLHVTGKILASYNDELLGVEAFKPGANPEEAEIRIKVTATRNTGDEPAEPMFVSLYQSAAGWRIFDLRAEGVSVARLYAGNFKVVLAGAASQAAARGDGLDRLIKLLEERNKLNAAQAGRTF
jgi:phospholipid transport system substrate-binding protein